METSFPAAINPDRIHERLVDLVRIPSVSGDEEAAIQRVASWLEESGAQVDHWRHAIAPLMADPDYPGHEVQRAWVPVVAGTLRGNRSGPTVLLTGHVDVVPPGNYDHWTHDPFSGITVGDRVYGRGTSDMKAGLVAALEAFTAFAGRERDFPGRVVFIAVPAEEDSGLGTLAAIRRGWRADAVIIPEPTTVRGLPKLIVAQAGAMSFRLDVPGRSAHASMRLLGENALDHFLTLYRAIREGELRINSAETHPLMAQLGLPYASSVGIIAGGDHSSNVIDSIHAEVRVGIQLGESIAEAESRFRAVLDDCVRQDRWLSLNPPGVERPACGFGSAAIPSDHPLVTTLSAHGARQFGQDPLVAATPYASDMSAWIHLADSPTVLYGPGEMACAHCADEWVSLAVTEGVARVLLETTQTLLEQLPGQPESGSIDGSWGGET
ncbi:MAG: ArgE/DapE family deacylase [Pseudomonadota bacterium]